MANGRKLLTHEEIAKYPKAVILAAIERRTLGIVMPEAGTRFDEWERFKDA